MSRYRRAENTPAQVALTCGNHTCRHTFEPDPVVFAAGGLACPRCGGWTFRAALVEPATATTPGGAA